jgi:hypothetical protein
MYFAVGFGLLISLLGLKDSNPVIAIKSIVSFKSFFVFIVIKL